MSSETASALSSLWFTYLLQSATGYVLLWLLCRFVRDPQFRFRICGIFLGAMVAAWLGLLLLSGLAAPVSPASAARAGVSETHWPWTLNLALTPRFATILAILCWAYVAILALFLLRFCARFWRLRTLLRASLPASETLSALFESVRLSIEAPRCELRLVAGLRSPAATGWWRPKILLPDELFSRLETPQLAGILRHELTHVRRRDYLWDRLATLGCYLLFFHPAAWLVRRHLRWDRELVCDDRAVDRSDVCRVEYAACLTTLASWRLSGKDFVGPIDFLSQPSLLATRVRAMVSPPQVMYSAIKSGALACLATVSLIPSLRLVPEVTFTTALSANAMAPRTTATTQVAAPQAQHLSPLPPKRMSQRHKLLVPEGKVQYVHSRSASSSPKSPGGTSTASGPYHPQTQPDTKRRPALWRFIPRFGGWAIHSVKLGFSKIGSHLAGDRHPKEPSGELSSVSANAGPG
jgi:beta-lactamase regulating signal transducer with metallopeptidase domain